MFAFLSIEPLILIAGLISNKCLGFDKYESIKDLSMSHFVEKWKFIVQQDCQRHTE
jgi:hypothetical protein